MGGRQRHHVVGPAKLGGRPATGCAAAQENTVRTDSTPDFAISANWPSSSEGSTDVPARFHIAP